MTGSPVSSSSSLPRLRARVRRVTGRTHHFLSHLENGAIVHDAEIPPAAWVELVPVDGAFFLFHLDEDLRCAADTWHRTLGEAKAQARFEYEIDDADWAPVSD
jgi:hypothetical protein